MPTTPYDAIIVGSGITGGWAAKELTEKGLNTLVLEAGRTIVPERDYVVFLDSRPPGRRQIHHLGTAELSLERSRL